jgi:hypothetical protein
MIRGDEMISTRTRNLEELLKDPEYIRLKERQAEVNAEIISLQDENMDRAGYLKWELVEGKIRAYQHELLRISERQMEIANKEIEVLFPSKLDRNAPIQVVGKDLFDLIK